MTLEPSLKTAALGSTALDLGADIKFRSRTKTVTVLPGFNLGHQTWTIRATFRDIIEHATVPNDPNTEDLSQRPLDEKHAKRLATYELRGLIKTARAASLNELEQVKASITDPSAYEAQQMIEPIQKRIEALDDLMRRTGKPAYAALQPFVGNIRELDPAAIAQLKSKAFEDNGETIAYRVSIPVQFKWRMNDGQHRYQGAIYVNEFLGSILHSAATKYKKANIANMRGDITPEHRAAWSAVRDAYDLISVTIEVHLGLTVIEERQLFHDLNNRVKPPHISLALMFDMSNPINAFVREVMDADLGIKFSLDEKKNWNDDDGSISFRDLSATNAIAFLNKSNVKDATIEQYDAGVETVTDLWRAIAEIPHFGEPKSKVKTVAAQSVVLKALAKIHYDLVLSNRAPHLGAELFEQFLASGLAKVDFSHNNPMWRFYDLTEAERVQFGLEGLKSYLPDNGAKTSTRIVAGIPKTIVRGDIGRYSDGLMSFDVRSNDVYPILADMIRWQSGLPSRFAPVDGVVMAAPAPIAAAPAPAATEKQPEPA